MRRLAVAIVHSCLIVLVLTPALAGKRLDRNAPVLPASEPILLSKWLDVDPASAPDLVLAGAAPSRAAFEAVPPAWPGDAAGALVARYDSGLPTGLLGFRLSHKVDQEMPFTLAAAIVIRSAGFAADPNGFAQISLGMWSERTTGLDRTGDFSSFAADSFDLLELDWFPNVSEFFGGPFLAPSLFGAADTASPSFPALGAFANAAFAPSVEAGLPFDVPLLVLVEHRPDLGAAVVQVHRIVGADTLPVHAAVVGLDPTGLALRAYLLDTAGLTMWHDGFGGVPSSLDATVELHRLVVREGLFGRPADALRVRPR